MRAVRFHANPAAVLLLVLLYSSLETRELAALLSAVLVHEFGHLAALCLLGLQLCELRLELTRYFGSVGSFYNYRQGRRVMGVLKRQHVIEVFARWCVGEDDVLDEQWTGYYFDHGEELDDYPGRPR